MKTALVFSGYFRSFSEVNQSLMDNLITPLGDVDVFFVSPPTMFAPVENEEKKYQNIYCKNSELVEPKVINFFGDKLKKYEFKNIPKDFYIDIVNKFNLTEKSYCDQLHWRILSYIQNIQMSMRLLKKYIKENKINYDLVILTRPDIKYISKIDTNNIDLSKVNWQRHAINDNKDIMLPDDCGPSPSLKRSFNDQILAGGQKVMLSFCNIYENTINKYIKEGIHVNNETLLGIDTLRNGFDFCGNEFIIYQLWR